MQNEYLQVKKKKKRLCEKRWIWAVSNRIVFCKKVKIRHRHFEKNAFSLQKV